MIDLNTLPLADLYRTLRASGLVTRLLELARDEDLGERWEQGDVTSRAFVPGHLRGRASIVFRTAGVAAGLACVDEVLHLYRADVDFAQTVADGQHVEAGAVVGTLTGNLRAILGAERPVLNLLGRLSGIATRTARFVQAAAVGGAKAGVYDTRKTTPGLRTLEKYAVRCGGGRCHRLGLFDAVLIKDNHLAAVRIPASGGPGAFAETVTHAAARARDEAGREGLRFVMLEVDTLDQLAALLGGPQAPAAGGPAPCGIDIVLLDNMDPPTLRRAVQLRDQANTRTQLEASGGVTIETVGAIAATGVDRISTGSLTHGATWLDVALDMEPPSRPG
ncbi:MAG: carboxylating nicotinate-nucleotide diphosphorylase [Phycisphaeraceae bacterium]|nr:carboxylating nicotinate-nucleotide diphosphorylase [Phycisphaeraceae bacterium]